MYLLPESWLPWAAGFGAALFAAGLTLRLCRRSSARIRAHLPLRRLLCAALGLGFGLLWCRGYAALALAPAQDAAGRYDSLEAELCAYPEQTDYGKRADAYVLVYGKRVKARLYLYGPLPELEPGDRIRGSFTLRRADRNADGDSTLALQSAGILLTGSGRVTDWQPGNSPLRCFPARLSRRIFLRLGELIPADAAGLPQAMLTGNRSGLGDGDRAALSAAGASHIIAVSGLHVSMLLGVLILLTGRGRLSVLLGLPLLGLFVLMTGASPSVIRAACMLSVFLLAPLAREENDPPSSLALAALLILLGNPWAAANVSFQLSFGAVAGLLLVTPPLLAYLLELPVLRRLLRWPGPKAWPRLPRLLLLRLLRGLLRFLCSSLSATLGALIFTVPIAAAVFGSMPVYSVLTNLLVLPLSTLVLTGALAVLALGLLSTVLGSWAGWLLAWPVRAVLWICRGIARLPGRSLWMDGYGLGFLLFACGLLLLLLVLREKKYGLPLLCLLGGLAAAVGFQYLEARSGDFRLGVLDVGQGQCVCIRSGGFTAVVDCGGSGSYTGSLAADWLSRHGAERIDALILTHYDSDHMEGVPALLERMPAAELWLPEVDSDPENRAAVEAAALEAGAALRYVRQDMRLTLPGASLRLFAPVSDRNDNAACVCVLFSAGEYDMLVPGDLDAAGEYSLLERETLPRVELLVAGHHGSAGSSSEALLEALRPDTVFISVGRGNRYGLPSPEALARLEAAGAAIYRTDECGDLEIGR